MLGSEWPLCSSKQVASNINQKRQDTNCKTKEKQRKGQIGKANICNKKGKIFVQSVVQSNRKGHRKRSIRLFCLVCHSGECWCVKVIGICLALCIIFTEAEACCCRECRLKLTKTKGQLMLHYFSQCFLHQLLSGQENEMLHYSPPMFLPLFFGPVAEWPRVYSDATKLKGQTLPPIFRTFSPQLKCGSLLSLFSTNEQKTSSELEICSSHSTLNKVVEYLRLLIKIVTRQIIIMAARSSKIAQCTRLTVLTYHWALSWPKQKVIRHWRRFAAAFFASSHTLSSIT